MLKKLLLIMVIGLFSAQAEAHSYYHHHHHHHHSHHSKVGPRPQAWCGWFMGKHLGMLDRSLWVASNWAHVGSPTHAKPGAIVVWPHHVGQVKAVNGSKILVLSGNDGHAVRTRWRTTRGVIAFREI